MFPKLTRKKESEGGREKKEKEDVFIYLRRIHGSWMLWLVAVVFTVIISPFMFLVYQIPGAFILIPVAVCVSTYGGNKLGNKIIITFFLKEVMQKHDLGAHVLWIARLSLILFPIILLMDLASIASESYYNGVITQYYLYWASVILLMLLTFLLLFSVRELLRKLLLFSVRKRGGEMQGNV
ncbi:MAG: hypothetical protein IMF19_14115 [Proteobacteria bacterium]|nr:hypothetical protein [Pseudomonadota bacterium]